MHQYITYLQTDVPSQDRTYPDIARYTLKEVIVPMG